MAIKDKFSKVSWLRVFATIVVWAWFFYVFIPSKYSVTEDGKKDIFLETVELTKFDPTGKKIAVMNAESVKTNERDRRSLFNKARCVIDETDGITVIRSDYAMDEQRKAVMTFYQNVELTRPDGTVMTTSKAIYDSQERKIVCPMDISMKENTMETKTSNMIIYLNLNIAKTLSRVEIAFDKEKNR